MIDHMLACVRRFAEEVRGVDVPLEPTMLTNDRKARGVDHLYEEFEEYREADTLWEEADALVDLVYVSLGRLVEMGITPGPAFDAVHEANMNKMPGRNAKRPKDGYDAVKPLGWEPPDLEAALSAGLREIDELAELKKTAMKFGLKILVIGHARHGKDTVCEILQDEYGMAFTSSSLFCAEHVVMPYFRNKAPTPAYIQYSNVQECFDDRSNHRAEWYEAIRDFNRPDASALGRAIFAENDVYCGLRSKAELNALVNARVADFVIWVDRSDHQPPEDRSSCTVEPWMAHYVLDNNGTPEDLRFNVRQLMGTLLGDGDST